MQSRHVTSDWFDHEDFWSKHRISFRIFKRSYEMEASSKLSPECFLSWSHDCSATASRESASAHFTGSLIGDGGSLSQALHDGPVAIVEDASQFRPLLNLETAKEASGDDLPFLVFLRTYF